MAQRSTVSIKLVLLLAGAVFALQVYRAASQPITREEAYLYDRFVRPTLRQVFASELPNHHVLYTLLEKRSVGLLHVSPFAVRLPSVLLSILYLGAMCRLAQLLSGTSWRFLAGCILACAVPVFWDGFARATGTGVAVALMACAVSLAARQKHLNLIGFCLGLSITADTTFVIPVALVALAVLAIQRHFWEWTNRILIPGVVTAVLFMVLPLAHSHASPGVSQELTAKQAAHLQSALAALRSGAGNQSIRISAVPVAEPIVNFYRAQHRANNWGRAISGDSREHSDYYLLSASAADTVEQRHLIVVYRDADFLVARAPAAAM